MRRLWPSGRLAEVEFRPGSELATSLVDMRLPAGAQIITAGERGDRFYVIDSGEVEVFEGETLARQQGGGDYFGEIALLRDISRTATVVARSDVELLALEREDFLDAVTRDRLSTQAAETVIASRLGTTRRRAASKPDPAAARSVA